MDLKPGTMYLTRDMLEKLATIEPSQALKKSKNVPILKFCTSSRKKPHIREFTLDEKSKMLRWNSGRKRPNAGILPIHDILRLVPGTDSDFLRAKASGTIELKDSLEIVARSRSLHLNFESQVMWGNFVAALASLMEYVHREEGSRGLVDYFHRQWLLSDIDCDGQLSFDEIYRMMHKMNMSPGKKMALDLFKSYDTDNSGTLEESEFQKMMISLISCTVCTGIFNKYRTLSHSVPTDGVDDGCLTELGMRLFLMKEQDMTNDEANAELKIIFSQQSPHTATRPSSSPASPPTTVLTNLGFFMYLSSDTNALMDPRRQSVHQDMNRPLTDYWCNSSHNTYLEGDQVMGRSSVAQYIKVLMQGCRCVELDCWDGSDGEPIVYHGGTFTSRIKFEDIIIACKNFGFQTSPFPVILSLEMHCSPKQKIRIGQILQDVLGDQIWVPNASTQRVPSPEELKYKFLVKAKVPPADFPRVPPVDVPAFFFSSGTLTRENTIQSNPDEALQRSASLKNPTPSRKIHSPSLYDQSVTALHPFALPFSAPLHSDNEQRGALPSSTLDTNFNDRNDDDKLTKEQSSGIGKQNYPPPQTEKSSQFDDPLDDIVAKGVDFSAVEALQYSSSKQLQILLRNPEESKNKMNSLPHDDEDEEEEEEEEADDDDTNVNSVNNSATNGDSNKTKNNQKLAVYIKQVALNGLRLDSTLKPLGSGRSALDICSLSELKVTKLIQKRAVELAAFHRQHLSRIYPHGMRITSGNYNPLPCWIMGAQIVALNFQDVSFATILNKGFFSLNGGIEGGYVLKPTMIREGPVVDYSAATAPPESNFLMKVTILAASQIPKPNDKGEIVDPFVVVNVSGNMRDCREYKTPVVHDNGFNPVWDKQVFEFPIFFPSLAHLTFEVRDMDTLKSTRVACCSVPVSAVRSGVRCVRLWDSKLRRLPWSHLLVKVELFENGMPILKK
eukprot:GDKJ01030313.1.p1 GENE.GDKJ01030313.1~~GDKJ01030313.1.p1  ORF type:complete len:954 (-),score=218.03 GDKJ01030313.1:305-3166(-)